MSISFWSDSDGSCEMEELTEIMRRCEELTKEKNMLRMSQSQSLGLLRRLELHATSLTEARIEDEKYIQELERELRNSSQEIEFLQDQLNSRNTEINLLDEHVHNLKLKLVETEILQEAVSRLQEELGKSDSERLFLLRELDSKKVELQKSTKCIEKLEKSLSYAGLESQCEIESMKLDLISLEESYFEAKKSTEEIVKENFEMSDIIKELEAQKQEAQKAIQCLKEDNRNLNEKLDSSDANARQCCQMFEEYLSEFLEDNNTLQCETQVTFHEETRAALQDMNTFDEVLGVLRKLRRVVASHKFLKHQADKMSDQVHKYELVVRQLKDELKEERLKAKEEAEDLTQEMAELRYEVTGLLEQECERRVRVEQASLQRIAELEAQLCEKKDSSLAASSIFMKPKSWLYQ